MAKNYSVFARAYAGVIKRGWRKIEDVRPDEMRQEVIEILALEGLGTDGKPLAKDEPKKPVEGKKEGESSKDTKGEEKTPVSEDKGDK